MCLLRVNISLSSSNVPLRACSSLNLAISASRCSSSCRLVPAQGSPSPTYLSPQSGVGSLIVLRLYISSVHVGHSPYVALEPSVFLVQVVDLRLELVLFPEPDVAFPAVRVDQTLPTSTATSGQDAPLDAVDLVPHRFELQVRLPHLLLRTGVPVLEWSRPGLPNSMLHSMCLSKGLKSPCEDSRGAVDGRRGWNLGQVDFARVGLTSEIQDEHRAADGTETAGVDAPGKALLVVYMPCHQPSLDAESSRGADNQDSPQRATTIWMGRPSGPFAPSRISVHTLQTSEVLR